MTGVRSSADVIASAGEKVAVTEARAQRGRSGGRATRGEFRHGQDDAVVLMGTDSMLDSVRGAVERTLIRAPTGTAVDLGVNRDGVQTVLFLDRHDHPEAALLFTGDGYLHVKAPRPGERDWRLTGLTEASDGPWDEPLLRVGVSSGESPAFALRFEYPDGVLPHPGLAGSIPGLQPNASHIRGLYRIGPQPRSLAPDVKPGELIIKEQGAYQWGLGPNDHENAVLLTPDEVKVLRDRPEVLDVFGASTGPRADAIRAGESEVLAQAESALRGALSVGTSLPADWLTLENAGTEVRVDLPYRNDRLVALDPRRPVAETIEEIRAIRDEQHV